MRWNYICIIINVTYFNRNIKPKRPLKCESNNTLTNPQSLVNLEGNYYDEWHFS